MSNTSLADNTVFHSLLMSGGSRTSWRSYLAQQADILQAGDAAARARARALPLDNFSTSWWMQGCAVSGNRLRLPPGSSASSTTAVVGRIDSTSSADGGGGGSSSSVGGGSAADASLLAGGGSGGGSNATTEVPNEWLQAVPYASYSDALSAVLDAGAPLLDRLAQGGQVCHAALRQAVDAQQAQLTLQVMLRASAPAVLWASTTQGYLTDSSISGNSGFFHTLRRVCVCVQMCVCVCVRALDAASGGVHTCVMQARAGMGCCGCMWGPASPPHAAQHTHHDHATAPLLPLPLPPPPRTHTHACTHRLDNAFVTLRDVTLSANEAALSVFDLWFGDAWIDGARLVGNEVSDGGIMNFESFRGHFQEVRLCVCMSCV
jgi:hypothetical protein